MLIIQAASRLMTREWASTFSSTVLTHKANLLSERYVYPACRCRQSSLIQILKFYERPCIVPHEVTRLNVVFSGSLRRNRF